MNKNLAILLIAVAAILGGGGLGYLAIYLMGSGEQRMSDSVATPRPMPAPATAVAPAPRPPVPQPVPEIFDSWQVQCIQDAQSQQACRAQHIVFGQDGAPQLAVLVRAPASGAVPQGTVVPPWGVLIERGVALRVDAMPATIVPIGSCQQAGCAADFVLNDALQAQLRQGTTLQVSMVAANGTPLSVSVPLAGFNQAYRRLLERTPR